MLEAFTVLKGAEDMHITLKDGRTVEVRPLKPNEDVFEMTRFMNKLIADGAYLVFDKPITPEYETDWLQNKMKSVEEDNSICWTVELDGKYVGYCDVTRGKDIRRISAEAGIALSKELQSQGLGYKLLSAIIKEAKERWGLTTVWLSHIGGNEHAHALYEKLGFVDCGVIPKMYIFKGKQVGKVFMVLKE